MSGLLIFDPEGEYALPDAHGRPGSGQRARAYANRISLYTNRKVDARTPALGKKGEVFVDFGDFPPQDIVAAFIPQEKQDMVFANLLRSLKWDVWKELVRIPGREMATLQTSKKIGALLLRYKPSGEGDVSLGAIKNNLLPPHAPAAPVRRDSGQKYPGGITTQPRGNRGCFLAGQ